MNQYTFRLCGIQKEYEQRRVLHIHELDIYPHEMLAVVGPSGAGKSTLLRLLNFLEPPSEGTIEFKGHVVDRSTRVGTDVRRLITTVFQRPLLVRGSVIKNVLLGLRFRGDPDGDEMAMRALEQVGMQSMAARRALDLSGGEMQRVALARSIILEPDVLLLDEPTANLDPANVRSFEQSLHRIKEQDLP
ncbi:MAG: ATP-binding cassette domain-containing protein [Chloroflexota bacterium]